MSLSDPFQALACVMGLPAARCAGALTQWTAEEGQIRKFGRYPFRGVQIPCLTGQPKAVRLGGLICSMRVSQGTSWHIEEDLVRLCQRDVPFKCLLICWAPEREAPDSKDLSILTSSQIL